MPTRSLRQCGVMSFEQAEAMLGKKNSVLLCQSTRLVRCGGFAVTVRLYNTDVVQINRDGTYTLRTGGWRTVTTKDRLNRFSPATVHVVKKQWMLNGEPFVDGVVVDGTGATVVEG